MRMITRACVAAAVLLMGATTVSATDQNIKITATVAGFCLIQDPANLPNAPADPDTIDWTGLITNGIITATGSTKTYKVICNKPSNVTLIATRGGLTDTSLTTVAGFDDIIRYSATTNGFVSVAGATTAGTSLGTAVANETLGTTTARATPGAANINVVITPVANSQPLQAGAYEDTLIVRIVPQ